MDDWQEHQVKFMPAEGLSTNETSVRVLDEDASKAEQLDNVMARIELMQEDTTVEQLVERQKLTEAVKSDPGYKFLMMVAAFSSLQLSEVVYTDVKVKVAESVIGRGNTSDEDWLQAPEVSGLVQLSTKVYGHMKEAESIVQGGFLRVHLKTLVENERYALLFARLVCIRMALSDALVSKRDMLNSTFSRLHQEQTMVLRALRCRRGVREHDWTRPYHSQ